MGVISSAGKRDKIYLNAADYQVTKSAWYCLFLDHQGPKIAPGRWSGVLTLFLCLPGTGFAVLSHGCWCCCHCLGGMARDLRCLLSPCEPAGKWSGVGRVGFQDPSCLCCGSHPLAVLRTGSLPWFVLSSVPLIRVCRMGGNYT